MTKWFLGGLATALVACTTSAQVPRVTSGYLVIRVILDGGGGNAGGFAAGGGAPGVGGEGGGDPRGGGGPRGGPGGGPGVPGGPRGGGGPGGPSSPDGGGGFAPGAGGLGGFGGQAAGSVSADPAKSVVVVVPFNNLKREYIYPPPGGRGNKQMDSITHKFGKTFLFQDRTSIQFYPNQGLTYESEVRRRHNEWIKNRVLSDGYRLCRDALAHGMLNEAFTYSRELANQVDVKKDIKPPADVAEFVTAFRTFESAIDTPPAKPGNAPEFQRRLQGETSTDSTHYTLIHPQDVPPAEVNRRLDMLEKNFKAFYLWHAMARKPLPLPDARLTVVMPKTATEVDRLRAGLDGSAIVSDATFARHHNLVVLSPERLDENSRAFQNLVAPLWREGYAREDLLKGIAPKNVTTRTADDHARAMTLALVDKALEDEADFAALTREGTRQLYIASGQLPQNVTLPEWVETGSSSLFQKPKGPLFTNEGTRKLMTVSLSAGYGSPNFHYRRYFQTMERGGKLNPNRADLLKNTVTDAYFAAARSGDDADPALGPPRAGSAGGAPGVGGPPPGAMGPGGPRGGAPRPGGGPGGDGISEGGGPGATPNGPGNEQDPDAQKTKNKADLLIKAQTTAWALTYYLSREKMSGLQDFYAQLRRMPRDLHLDEKTVLNTFCRSFNLMKGDEIDQSELDRFAQGWIDYMKNAPFFHMDIPLNDPAAQPGGGFGPGGGIGPGGPGGGGPGGGPGSPG